MNIRELESWVNREINIVVEQLKESQRYTKSRREGYLSALKKVQNNIRR